MPETILGISIHAPREGSDSAGCCGSRDYIDFYPRSPRGERLYAVSSVLTGGVFLSTLPARGATQQFGGILDAHTISIHAPREGSDPRPCRAF